MKNNWLHEIIMMILYKTTWLYIYLLSINMLKESRNYKKKK